MFKTLLISFACIIGLIAAPVAVHATQQDKVLLCHKTHSDKNPYVVQSVNANEAESHIANGDFLFKGEDKDAQWCVDHAPIVSECNSIKIEKDGLDVTVTVDGTADTFTYDFGDGTKDQTSESTDTHTYKASGTYQIHVSADDNKNCCKGSVTVSSPPITPPSNPVPPPTPPSPSVDTTDLPPLK